MYITCANGVVIIFNPVPKAKSEKFDVSFILIIVNRVPKAKFILGA